MCRRSFVSASALPIFGDQRDLIGVNGGRYIYELHVLVGEDLLFPLGGSSVGRAFL